MRVREADERNRVPLDPGPESNKDDVVSFQRNLTSIFVRETGREPLALHLVVRHPVDLHDLTEQDGFGNGKGSGSGNHAVMPR